MAKQIMLPVPSRQASASSNEAAMPLPRPWDADAQERMIVERAMRPRSWETDTER